MFNRVAEYIIRYGNDSSTGEKRIDFKKSVTLGEISYELMLGHHNIRMIACKMGDKTLCRWEDHGFNKIMFDHKGLQTTRDEYQKYFRNLLT